MSNYMSNYNETNVLKARDPSLTNSDDWPIYKIKSAVVYDPAHPMIELVSLLHAGVHRPLTITGRLDLPSKDMKSMLLQPKLDLSHPVEITNVKSFSYGQYEDGSVEIWAEGQAGWFTISPGRSYKGIHADMVEALKVWYVTVDAYKEAKKASPVDVNSLFVSLSTELKGLCKTEDEARSLFAKHRYFIFASMLDGKEGLQWSRLSLFKYYDLNFPDDTALIRQRRALAMKPPRAPSRKRSTQSPASSNASLKRKRNDRTVTPARPISIRSSSRSASVMTATLPMKDDSIRLSQAQSRSQRSSRRSSVQSATTSVAQGNDSDADSEQFSRDRKGFKGQSSLRPKPVKYINSEKHGIGMPDGNDADDDETDAPRGPAQTSPNSKRKMLDDQKSSRSRRRTSQMTIDDPIDFMIVDTDQDVEDSTSLPSDSHQDVKQEVSAEKQSKLPYRFRVGEDDAGDIWRCPNDGCMHRVYAASEATSKIMIENHQGGHEYDEDQRVQLVRRMEAPWLPVSRLMDRVRELAAQDGLPTPIVRRF